MGQVLSQGPLFLICLVFMMGIVVIVHELGHYWVGRWFGAASESFSVGFGKPIFEVKDKRNTRWRINWIPLGGFVKFVGEAQFAQDMGKIEQGPVGKPLAALSVWQRILVSLAGPFANFLLAAVIFGTMFGVHGRQLESVGIASVLADTPAERGGFLAGDALVSANGKPIESASDVIMVAMLNPNVPVQFVVQRDGTDVELTVTPDERVTQNEFGQVVAQGYLGVGLSRVAQGDRITYNPIEAFGQGIVETGATIDRTVTMLGRIVTGKMSVHTMTGPVGIGDVSRRVVTNIMDQDQLSTGQKVSAMFWTLLTICAAISVGVGFFNLLPLPVLDGGRVVFDAYEALTGKALPEKVQEVSLTFGLVLLLGLVVVITWGDIIETGLFGGTGS